MDKLKKLSDQDFRLAAEIIEMMNQPATKERDIAISGRARALALSVDSLERAE